MRLSLEVPCFLYTCNNDTSHAKCIYMKDTTCVQFGSHYFPILTNQLTAGLQQDFSCSRDFVNYGKSRGGPPDVHLCLYSTFVESKERFLSFFIFQRPKRFCPVRGYKVDTSEISRFSIFLLKMFAKSHVFFFLFYLFIYMYFAWLGARSCGFRGQFCTVCEPCSLVIHLVLYSSGLQTVSLQSHGLIQIILSFGCRKVHFSLNDLPFSTDSVLLSKKCQRYGKGICPSR